MAIPNDFQYFVIQTRAGWQRGRTEAVRIDEKGTLTLAPESAVALPEELGRPAAMAFDYANTLYVLDAARCSLYRFSSDEGQLMRVACLGGCGSAATQFQFSSRTGEMDGGRMVFSRSTLYIADTYNNRILAFHLPSFQLKFILGGGHDPNGAAFHTSENTFDRPKDILLDSKGNLYVLDSGAKEIRKFNRYGLYLKTVGAEGEPALQQPAAMTLDHEDNLYVIDHAQCAILKFDRCGDFEKAIGHLFVNGSRLKPVSMAIDHDGVIYLAEAQGENTGIHQFDLMGNYLGRFGSMAKAEACRYVRTDRAGNLYGICGEASLMRFGGEEGFARQGVYLSRIFDSTIFECQWHRLFMDADLADKTKINVYFYASDAPFESGSVHADDWRLLLSAPQNEIKTNDALFDQAVGRYLQIRFELLGDGRHAPAIKFVRLFFQRASYLRYLPATYQEDELGRDFLERYLSLFESMSLEVEEKIAGITRYFDPQGTAAEFLDWLGAWLAVVSDDNWPEDKRREFLEKAFALYKLRGTPRGLVDMIKLFTGGEASIVEHFRLRSPMVIGQSSQVGATTIVGKKPDQRLIIEESSVIGEFVLNEEKDPPERPFEHDAYDFTVLVDTSNLTSPGQEQALQRLIEDEKPAYTRYFLRTSQSAVMQLGVNSLLEVNTRLTAGFAPGRLGKNARLGEETFLGTKQPRQGVIGVRSRIAVEAVLH